MIKVTIMLAHCFFFVGVAFGEDGLLVLWCLGRYYKKLIDVVGLFL
jgi:hypothetical protein